MNEEIIRIDLEGVNAYLVKSKDFFVLFDTGGPLFVDKEFNNRCNQLESALNSAGCTPVNLKLLILTHGDLDHVFNAAYIKEKYKSSIAIYPKDLESVTNPTFQKVLENCRYRSRIHKIIFPLVKVFIKKIIVKQLKSFQKFYPDILIDDIFDLSKYGINATILHLPGHTSGSIGIVFEDGSLICGDTFCNLAKPSKALNAYHFKQMDQSIKNLDNYLINTVYPGHGNPFSYTEFKQTI